MGAGYHVIELIRRFKIQHMVVIEHSPELMNLSLYAINWKEVIDYFSVDSKKLQSYSRGQRGRK
ncbi:MAG: hypothetical protein Q9N34_05340 [Aquificota bacterium]|nr:hypothetical protein [Aquificota bacterium]